MTTATRNNSRNKIISTTKTIATIRQKHHQQLEQKQQQQQQKRHQQQQIELHNSDNFYNTKNKSKKSTTITAQMTPCLLHWTINQAASLLERRTRGC